MIKILNLTICLLASHFIGDFLFSFKIDETSKRRTLFIVNHAVIVAGLSYVLCGAWTSFEIPLLVLATHTGIDLINDPLGGKTLHGFLWDQIAHLILTILIAIGVTFQNSISLYWVDQFHSAYLRNLIFAAGGIITVRTGTFFVAAVVQPFLVQIEEKDQAEEEWDGSKSSTGGLKGAGSLIGQLERALIFLFIMIDQPMAIGFLITAKSILRFGEIKDFHHRRLTEYIIIGTMMSFAYGIFTSYLTKFLMNMIG
jgi:Protein of unknown function (DUF3307)